MATLTTIMTGGLCIGCSTKIVKEAANAVASIVAKKAADEAAAKEAVVKKTIDAVVVKKVADDVAA
jgi:hypothetical protein